MIRKDWNFCNQILQVAAILDKKLKFIFIFFNFNSIFFLIIFHSNIPLGFATIINLINKPNYHFIFC